MWLSHHNHVTMLESVTCLSHVHWWSPPAINNKFHMTLAYVTCLCHGNHMSIFSFDNHHQFVTRDSHDTYLCHMFITWQSHVIVHHWWSSPASLTWPLLVSHVYHIWNHMSLSTTDDHHLQVSHDTSLCHMSITWQSCVNILSCALIVLWKALPVEDSLDICYSVVSNSTRSSAMRQKYHN